MALRPAQLDESVRQLDTVLAGTGSTCHSARQTNPATEKFKFFYQI
jgi:hypothetical protein